MSNSGKSYRRLFAGGVRPLAVVLVVAALACGCAGNPNAAVRQPTGPHLTVATYNVNFGMPGPERTLGAIEAVDADVLCLQETNVQWQRFLVPRLKRSYPHMRFRSAAGAGGMAVLSKYPFKDVAILPPAEGGWFSAWVVRVESPVGPLQMVNVHLHPALSEKFQVTVYAYLATRDVRKREIRQHVGSLDRSLVTIILGDFNEPDDGGAMEWVGKQGFANALGQFDRRSPTWVWQAGWITLRDRFDHIMYDRRLDCLNARVVSKGASDHLPVVAVFQKAAG